MNSSDRSTAAADSTPALVARREKPRKCSREDPGGVRQVILRCGCAGSCLTFRHATPPTRSCRHAEKDHSTDAGKTTNRARCRGDERTRAVGSPKFVPTTVILVPPTRGQSIVVFSAAKWRDENQMQKGPMNVKIALTARVGAASHSQDLGSRVADQGQACMQHHSHQAVNKHSEKRSNNDSMQNKGTHRPRSGLRGTPQPSAKGRRRQAART